jgi:hypothetical protein
MQEQAENLVQAVSVFKLAQDKERAAVRADKPAAGKPKAEVRQLTSRGNARPQAPLRIAAARAPARARTGTGGDWTEF